MIHDAVLDERVYGPMAIDPLRAALARPDDPRTAVLVDIALEPLDGPFYAERRVDYTKTRVPGYFGACWGISERWCSRP